MQRDEFGVSSAQPGLDPDAPMTALVNQTVLDPPLNTKSDRINPETKDTELAQIRGVDDTPVAANFSRLFPLKTFASNQRLRWSFNKRRHLGTWRLVG